MQSITEPEDCLGVITGSEMVVVEPADKVARARPSENLGLNIAAKTEDAKVKDLEETRMF